MMVGVTRPGPTWPGCHWAPRGMSLVSLVRLVTRRRRTVRTVRGVSGLGPWSQLTCRAELGAEQQLLRLSS